MSYTADYRWVIYESRDGLQIGHKWVSRRSYISQRWVAYGLQDKLQINHIWGTPYITDASWISHFKTHQYLTPSHLCHTSNTKNECNFWPIRRRKPVVSFITLLWCVTTGFFAHWIEEIIHFAYRSFAGWEERKCGGQPHEKKALNTSLRRLPKPLACPCFEVIFSSHFWSQILMSF